MTDYESATHIVIALINNNRVHSAEEASEAYKTVLKAIANPQD